MSLSFDLLALLTSIPSETSIRHNKAFIYYTKIYFLVTLYETFSKNVLVVVVIFIFIKN